VDEGVSLGELVIIRQTMESEPKTERKKRAVVRTVKAQMKIYGGGTVSFHVRGYDFRWSEMPIAINGYMFAPVRPDYMVRPRCTKWGCDHRELTWMEAGGHAQTENGFLIPKVDGWYCCSCSGSYGNTPAP
jgi:hypothetical protein